MPRATKYPGIQVTKNTHGETVYIPVVRYTDPVNGKRHTFPRLACRTLKEAIEWQAVWRNDVHLMEHGIEPKNPQIKERIERGRQQTGGHHASR